MAAFLLADGLAWLYAARVLQGAATGLVTAAVAAALIDLQPPARPARGPLVNAITPTVGLAAGALAASALVQYGPAPLRLVYALLLAGFLLLAVAVAALPAGSTARRPVSLRPRVSVEPAVRPAFWAALPCLVATWALGGLYLSLGPSLILSLSHSGSRLLGGSLVFALCGAGPAARAMRTGCLLLLAGSPSPSSPSRPPATRCCSRARSSPEPASARASSVRSAPSPPSRVPAAARA